MKTDIHIQDVLHEVEFELAQGTVSRDDLGQAIQQVRQFHGKLRAEIYGPQAHALEVRDIVNRQFQLNDMMLTLLQEMSAALHDTQIRVARAHALATSVSTPSHDAASATFDETDVGAVSFGNDPLPAPPWADAQTEALHQAINTPLRQKIDARPVGIPLLGIFLTRVRAALHEVILFYINRLAERQARINGVFGETLLMLMLKRKSEV
jgi:hypothetical protein